MRSNLSKVSVIASVFLLSAVQGISGDLQNKIVEFHQHLQKIDQDKRKKDPVSPEVLWNKWDQISAEVSYLLGLEKEVITKLNKEYEAKVLPVSEQFANGEIDLNAFNKRTKDLRDPYFETINAYQQFFKACHTINNIHKNMDPDSLKADEVKFFHYESAFETISDMAKMIEKEKIPIRI